MNKIEKLNELNELYKSGVISKDEFDNLKKEIIEAKEDLNISKKQEIFDKSITNKEQINLKSFHGFNGKLVEAPSITHLDFKNISNDEIKLLNPFIKKKHIYASNDMTEDEIKIGNKLFTSQQIHEMESERPGFNYAFASILSLLAGIGAAYFLYLSPCLIFFCFSGLCASAFIALFTLSRINATKLDKIFCFLAIAADAIGIMFYLD
jgi:hypothetical protein